MQTAVLVVSLSWLVGGFVSGLVGIGGAMLAVPVAAKVLPIQEVIFIACILNIGMDVGLGLLHWRYCKLKALPALWLGAFPGSVVGVPLLLYLPDHVVRLIVGLSLLVFLYWQRLIAFSSHKESTPLACAAGFLSGVLGSAIAFDGPPVAAYALYAGWKPREVLGTLGIFFIVRGLLTVLLQVHYGLYSDLVLECGLYGFPCALLGTFASYPFARRLKLTTFASLLHVVLTLAAASCVLDGLRAFL